MAAQIIALLSNNVQKLLRRPCVYEAQRRNACHK